MKIKNVKVGDVLSVGTVERAAEGHKEIIYENWIVDMIYDHYVLAVRGGLRECFTYGELLQMGYETQRGA